MAGKTILNCMSAQKGEEIMNNWKRSAEILGNKLRPILRTPDLERVRRQTKGRVDARRIAQLAIGREDVFEKRLLGEGVPAPPSSLHHEE